MARGAFCSRGFSCRGWFFLRIRPGRVSCPLQKKLKRMLLLLRSPIASFHWARDKHKALAKLKQNAASGWQGRRSNSFAECERDGILMGF
jgi:hypothetical protein